MCQYITGIRLHVGYTKIKEHCQMVTVNIEFNELLDERRMKTEGKTGVIFFVQKKKRKPRNLKSIIFNKLIITHHIISYQIISHQAKKHAVLIHNSVTIAKQLFNCNKIISLFETIHEDREMEIPFYKRKLKKVNCF